MLYYDKSYGERAKVVSLHTLSSEIEKIELLIEQRIQHSFLERYIEKPIIDRDKIFILIHIFNIGNNGSIPSYKKQQYILTIMLIQLALDTHDLVPEEANHECKIKNTKKQLSVLAGDYYSGLYYLLLSEIEDIDMIRLLASAIRDINESKMRLHYYQDIRTDQEFMTILKNVETKLYSRVAKYMNHSITVEVIEEWLLLNRLSEEKTMIVRKTPTTRFNYLYENSHQSSVERFLDHSINVGVQRIEELLSNVPLNLITFKNYLEHSLMQLSYVKTSIAEEG